MQCHYDHQRHHVDPGEDDYGCETVSVDLNQVAGDEQVGKPQHGKIVVAIGAEIDSAQQVGQQSRHEYDPQVAEIDV